MQEIAMNGPVQAPAVPVAAVNRYARSKIYKIISEGTDQIYIGSTTQSRLSKRFSGHKSAHKNQEVNHKYVSSFALLDRGNCQIVLVEDFVCNNKDQMRAREQHHIDLNKAICVNNRRAIDLRTDEQKKADKQAYYEENKEAILAYQVQYHAENREANNACMLATNSQRIQCACGAHIQKGGVFTHKRTQKHMRWVARQQQPEQQQ